MQDNLLTASSAANAARKQFRSYKRLLTSTRRYHGACVALLIAGLITHSLVISLSLIPAGVKVTHPMLSVCVYLVNIGLLIERMVRYYEANESLFKLLESPVERQDCNAPYHVRELNELVSLSVRELDRIDACDILLSLCDGGDQRKH